jgi:hypothetical protein
VGKKYNYIKKGKPFDVRTIYTLISADTKEIDALLKRNVKIFQRKHTVEYAENLEELNILVREYSQWLKQQVVAVQGRLNSMSKTGNLNSFIKERVIKRTLKAVKESLEKYSFNDGASEHFIEILEIQKRESLNNFDTFMEYYYHEISIDTQNYTKQYLYTMLQTDYLFTVEKPKTLYAFNDIPRYGYTKEPLSYYEESISPKLHFGDEINYVEAYSLLIFLSFYEAYVKRMVGMAFIEYAKIYKIEEEWLDEKWAEEILDYVDNVKLTDAKSCYFAELQRWFKGDISEIIERLLFLTLPENFRGFRQKASLIEKKRLRSGYCNNTPEPPVEIPSPPLIEQFFLLRDSTYTNLISFSS